MKSPKFNREQLIFIAELAFHSAWDRIDDGMGIGDFSQYDSLWLIILN